ncbi:hypothetical protein [Massilia sp. TS11]|uniref:hypothetical protein n=1 Tax=Massilia sp. TS11 TaxID=2908003 RepID=UPI001EDAF1B6|nr:hypothetical protein [Massilia sp. TS11]MCG2583165.1 hypothetical protein [Massilia sp. TS11]
MSTEKHRNFLGTRTMLAVSGFALAASVSIIYGIHVLEPVQFVKAADGTMHLAPKSPWVAIFEHFATALFILGVWHIIDQLIVKREFKNEIVGIVEDIKGELSVGAKARLTHVDQRLDALDQSIKLAKHDTALGLVETYHDADGFGYAAIIRDSQCLVAVLADGYSWVSRNADALRERFENAEKTTTIILVHPESELIPVLSRKVGMQADLYRQRIFSTIRELQKLNGGRSLLRILGHSLINCHSVYIADRRAVFSPYFLSSHRRSPPIFVVKDAGKRSFFGKLSEDVAILEKECSLISLQLPNQLEIQSE